MVPLTSPKHTGATPREAIPASIQPLLGGAHIGVDEAGRGCMAGPVCAAALYAPAGFDFSSLHALDDSKKLSATARTGLERQIKSAPGLKWAIGMAWPGEIDRVNILNASLRAMSRAMLGLGLPLDGIAAFVDGPHAIPLPEWQAARRSVPPMPLFFAVIRGDALVPAISAASILAKTHRDRLMQALGRRYPLYGLEKHKGYGTKEHMKAIELHGPSPQHRLSFAAHKKQEQFRLLPR